jgi:hypothetical protein
MSQTILDPNTELAQIEQNMAIIAEYGDPAALLYDAGIASGALYDAAEARGDEAGKQHAMVVWERAQIMHDNLVRGQQVSAASVALAKAFAAQRDTTAAELESLTNALNWNGSHPLVSEFQNEIEGDALDYAFQSVDDGRYDAAQEWGIDGDIVTYFDELMGGDPENLPRLIELLMAHQAAIEQAS